MCLPARRGSRGLLHDAGKGSGQAVGIRTDHQGTGPTEGEEEARQAEGPEEGEGQVSDQATPTKAQGYEPCEECGAPLDPQQRYCVECAARRGNGSNPSSRYFAAMSKKSRRPLTKSQAQKPGAGSRAAAVGFFALLPIAVAMTQG